MVIERSCSVSSINTNQYLKTRRCSGNVIHYWNLHMWIHTFGVRSRAAEILRLAVAFNCVHPKCTRVSLAIAWSTPNAHERGPRQWGEPLSELRLTAWASCVMQITAGVANVGGPRAKRPYRACTTGTMHMAVALVLLAMSAFFVCYLGPSASASLHIAPLPVSPSCASRGHNLYF